MKRTLTVLIVLAVVVLGFTWAYKASAPIAPAPVTDAYEGWATATTNGFTFRYPDPLHGSYVSAAQWPPEISIATTTGCSTTLKIIGNESYCYSEEGEGAAGSTFVTYTYASEENVLAFTLRYPQCLNYDEPNQSACKLEQETFDIDTLAARILSSVQ